jgi:uncharacterized protein (DUF4415 family)
MKKQYDFGKGKRGAVDPIPPGKTRITIRLDDDILEWFRAQVDERGGGNYQTMINNTLRAYIKYYSDDSLEETIRRIVKEELRNTA